LPTQREDRAKSKPEIPKWDREHYATLISKAYKNYDEGGLDEIDEDEALAGSTEDLELDG